VTARAGLLLLLEALDRLEITYMVVGSAASSVYGLFRATADVDVVVNLTKDHVGAFVALLEKDFYVDAKQVLAALELRRPFNAIHNETAYKFDLFPLARDAYSAAEFQRRRYAATTILGGGEPIEMALCTPEDIILSKLRRYERGGRVSDRHWNDILGVIAVRRGALDLSYLREWAPKLGVQDLLETALEERHGGG
jgi:hypothetical protein